MSPRHATVTASVATAVSAVATAQARLEGVPMTAYASSPEAIDRGRMWLLVTSALVADRPILASLLGFWLVAVAALLVCSPALVTVAAIAGHILSTLATYALVAVLHALDPNEFAPLLGLPDYGLSAIIAAWIGALACVAGRRWPTPFGRSAVGLGSVACACIGLAVRSDVTLLDTEHLVAYAIGFALADGRLARGARTALEAAAGGAAALHGSARAARR